MTKLYHAKSRNKPNETSPRKAEIHEEEVKADPSLVRTKREKFKLLNDESSNAYFGNTKTEEGTADEVEKNIAKWALENGLNFFDNFDLFMSASKVGIYKNLEHNKRTEFFMKIPAREQDTMNAEVKEYIHSFVTEHIQNVREEGAIIAPLAPLNADGSHFIVAHPGNRAIYTCTLRVQVDGGAETLMISDSDFLIRAFLENVKLYNPTFAGKARKVEFDAISGINPSRAHIGPATDKDAVSALEHLGLVMDKTHALDAFRQAIAAYVESGKAEQLTGVDTPGFYKDPQSNRIITVGYTVVKPTLEELRVALQALDRISNKFHRSLNRFSIAVKWSIGAPFSYYLRQNKIYPQHLMFYGITGTSKTALLLISHGIWGLWDPESNNHGFFVSGGETDTPARLGERLEQGTFPLIIDEGEGLFLKSDGRENVPVIGILKHALQSTISRQTSDRGIFQALASVAIATNVNPPRGAAPILSRMATYESTTAEQIHLSIGEKERFQKLQNELYPQLGPIGRYVAEKIIESPSKITSDFEAFGESMLKEIYDYAGIEMPEWVRCHVEPTSIEDIDRDIKEDIRVYLYKSNIEAYSRNIGRTGVLRKSENGNEYPNYDDRTNVSAKQKIETSIKSGLIPWQIFKTTAGPEQVILTAAFAKEVSRIAGEAYNLQSIAELLGIEVRNSVRVGNSVQRAIVMNLEDYLGFLNPEITIGTSGNESKSGDKTDVEPHKDPQKTEEGEKEMDPVVKHLIDCTFNSTKKFKTVHELFRERPLGTDWPEAFIYQHLEKEASKGIIVRKGTGYGYRDLVEGAS